MAGKELFLQCMSVVKSWPFKVVCTNKVVCKEGTVSDNI
jgi:hypothetical protein